MQPLPLPTLESAVLLTFGHERACAARSEALRGLIGNLPVSVAWKPSEPIRIWYPLCTRAVQTV